MSGHGSTRWQRRGQHSDVAGPRRRRRRGVRSSVRSFVSVHALTAAARAPSVPCHACIRGNRRRQATTIIVDTPPYLGESVRRLPPSPPVPTPELHRHGHYPLYFFPVPFGTLRDESPPLVRFPAADFASFPSSPICFRSSFTLPLVLTPKPKPSLNTNKANLKSYTSNRNFKP